MFVAPGAGFPAGRASCATSKAAVIGGLQVLTPRRPGRGARIETVPRGCVGTAIDEAERPGGSLVRAVLPIDAAARIAWLPHPPFAAIDGSEVLVHVERELAV
jgi:hypothetical protein